MTSKARKCKVCVQIRNECSMYKRLILLFIFDLLISLHLCYKIPMSFVIKKKLLQPNYRYQRIVATPTGIRMISDNRHTQDHIKGVTQNWVSKWVVSQGLCPWASGVNKDNKLRIEVLQCVPTSSKLQPLLLSETALMLDSTCKTESTLLVIPSLTDFDEFLDFAEAVDNILLQTGENSHIQTATFHPNYCFADAKSTDISHYTNRSPYPIVHLLRVDDVTEAIKRVDGKTDFVWQNNIKRLNNMGLKKIIALQKDISQIDLK